MTMLQGILFFLCCVASLVTPQKRSAQCERLDIPSNFPETDLTDIPSKVAGLNVTLVTVGKERKLNISWAINIDASINYLDGTWIITDSSVAYICKYNFTQANLTGSTQLWFYLLEDVMYGGYHTNVFNVPLPPLHSGDQKLHQFIWVPRQKEAVAASVVTTRTPDDITGQQQPMTSVAQTKEIKDVTAIVVGVVASLIILSSCFVIYKMCVSYSGYGIIPTTVSVVVVYPAETPAFQRAVVSLAEFLQWHGGCRVAIDLWQQEKIAKLGPLRWLAERVKDADRVLIISSQGGNQSSMPVQSKKLPEHSIPAAADDLYPLILNMVACHAKSPSELAKFWVVQLHVDKDKKSRVLLPELQTCRVFCLMKDLKTLCNSLHTPKKIGKIFKSLLFKPKIFYCQNSTAKLREAIEMLSTKKPGICNGVLDKVKFKSSQVELYCHSATCGDIQWNEMSCLAGPRCYINTEKT